MLWLKFLALASSRSGNKDKRRYLKPCNQRSTVFKELIQAANNRRSTVVKELIQAAKNASRHAQHLNISTLLDTELVDSSLL